MDTQNWGISIRNMFCEKDNSEMEWQGTTTKPYYGNKYKCNECGSTIVDPIINTEKKETNMNLQEYVKAVLEAMPENTQAEVTVRVVTEKGKIEVNELGLNTITFKLVK